MFVSTVLPLSTPGHVPFPAIFWIITAPNGPTPCGSRRERWCKTVSPLSPSHVAFSSHFLTAPLTPPYIFVYFRSSFQKRCWFSGLLDIVGSRVPSRHIFEHLPRPTPTQCHLCIRVEWFNTFFDFLTWTNS